MGLWGNNCYLNDIKIFVTIELNLWLDRYWTISYCTGRRGESRCNGYRTRIYWGIASLAKPLQWRWTRRWRWSLATLVVKTRWDQTTSVRGVYVVRLWVLQSIFSQFVKYSYHFLQLTLRAIVFFLRSRILIRTWENLKNWIKSNKKKNFFRIYRVCKKFGIFKIVVVEEMIRLFVARRVERKFRFPILN